MDYLKIRGKQISLLGSNVVNNIKTLYPDLFTFESYAQELKISCAEGFSLCLTSLDGIDTDYRYVSIDNDFSLSGITFSNIKIKSTNAQTGFIWTAGK